MFIKRVNETLHSFSTTTLRYTMIKTLHSERLSISALEQDDAPFMYQLLNSEGWLTFIGNRNIDNLDAAENYVAKLYEKGPINYWKVVRKEDGVRLGIMTLLKKDYLDYYDIGFAFLPEYGGQGYASEASKALLNHAKDTLQFEIVTAVVLESNGKSIHLLTKLGFTFQHLIVQDEEELLVYNLALTSTP
jgi:[ribosomal protein S5]-alanine N-acetyltransferase